jgi:hypothetical protein
LRPQSGGLIRGELKREILWKPGSIAPDLLIEALGGHPVEGGQIGIDDKPVAAHDIAAQASLAAHLTKIHFSGRVARGA